MSPVAIGLDLLLVSLLLVTLLLGLQLNQRLKQLRAGQVSFVKAVAELDASALRADSALKALRIASEETHDELLTRIETARGLVARLDALSASATSRPMEGAASAQPRGASPLRVDERAGEPRPWPPAPPPRRSPARGVDDDLFEAAEPGRNAAWRRSERP